MVFAIAVVQWYLTWRCGRLFYQGTAASKAGGRGKFSVSEALKSSKVKLFFFKEVEVLSSSFPTEVAFLFCLVRCRLPYTLLCLLSPSPLPWHWRLGTSSPDDDIKSGARRHTLAMSPCGTVGSWDGSHFAPKKKTKSQNHWRLGKDRIYSSAETFLVDASWSELEVCCSLFSMVFLIGLLLLAALKAQICQRNWLHRHRLTFQDAQGRHCEVGGTEGRNSFNAWNFVSWENED